MNSSKISEIRVVLKGNKNAMAQFLNFGFSPINSQP